MIPRVVWWGGPPGVARVLRDPLFCWRMKHMEQFLKNRIALVTGGTRGIGRAISEALLGAGATLAICGRDQAGVDRAVMEMSERSKRRVVGSAADVSRSEDVSRFVEFVDRELGGLDILFNNAGVGVFKRT